MTDRVTWIDKGQLGAGRWIKSSDGRQIAIFYGPNINPHADRDVATAVNAFNLREAHQAAAEALQDTLNMLRAAHMQCGVHHDSNKRVIKARAVLAKLEQTNGQ